MPIPLPKTVEQLPEFVQELRFPFTGKTDFVGVCRLLTEKWRSERFEITQAELERKYNIKKRNRKFFDLCFVELEKGNTITRKGSIFTLSPSLKHFVQWWSSVELDRTLYRYSDIELCTKMYLFNGKTYTNKSEIRKEVGVKNTTVQSWRLEKQDIRSLICEDHCNLSIPAKKYNFKHPVFYNKQAVQDICELYRNADRYQIVLDAAKDPNPLPELMEDFLRVGFGNPFLDAFYTKHPFGRYFCYAPDLRYIEWQLLPKVTRGVFFKDYYEYDIEAAAPNILMQYAEKHGFGTDWPYIKDYVNNKEDFREMMADMLGISLKGAKKALTSLFFGSRVANTEEAFKHTQLSDLLIGYSNAGETEKYFDRVVECFNSERYGGLIRDIQKLFKLISDDMLNRADDQKFYFKDGVALPKRHVKMSKGLYKRNSLVAAVYQHEESKILEALMEKYEYQLLLHDAFVSQHDYDVDEMQEYILAKTGYKLSIVQELLEDELTERLKKYVT